MKRNHVRSNKNKNGLFITAIISTLVMICVCVIVCLPGKDRKSNVNNNSGLNGEIGSDVNSESTDKEPEIEKKKVVTSFYPMYDLTRNLLILSKEYGAFNLAETATGCLHDYELSTKDMKTLSDAEGMVINGADMEPFAEQIAKNFPELKVIEASKGIELLNENGHVWLSIDNYKKEAENVKKGLIELLPSEKENVELAYEEYIDALDSLKVHEEEVAKYTKGFSVVNFHEAYTYLTEDLGLTEIAMCPLDENSLPSAGEISKIIEKVKAAGKTFIFIEKGNARYAEKITNETEATVVYIDPCTYSAGRDDGYITIMDKNLINIEEALGEQIAK